MLDSGWKRLAITFGAGLALVMSAMPAAAATTHQLGDAALYVRHPDAAAQAQIGALRDAGQREDANRLSWMLNTPQAVWFTGGTPDEVYAAVKNTMKNAAAKGTVPVLVAYNIPYRDCAQYSAGGATNVAAYAAWIDAFAAGIGSGRAVILLEPDSLGIIPYYTPLYGSMEWCQPKVDGNPAPEADPEHRFAALNHAVDSLEARPNTVVYLDATHASWVGVGGMADRLIQGGVKAAQGFYTNVSNYQTTATSAIYGRWISECIARTDKDAWWNPNWCPSQYNAATGYTVDYSAAYVASVDEIFASWGVSPTAHFVIDTSRNGLGPWVAPSGVYSDAQDWCNPPDRGLGVRPTTTTGVPLLDAYLWVKTPGESDGQCTRGTAGGIDPVRGYADPAAGAWFPQQALELVRLAQPAMPTTRPNPAW